jgi:hypothetical protein
MDVFIGELYSVTNYLPTGKVSATITKFFETDSPLLDGKKPIEFLGEVVMDKFRSEGMFSAAGKAEGIVSDYNHLKKLYDGLSSGKVKASSMIVNPKTKGEPKPAYRVLEELERFIYGPNLSKVLTGYGDLSNKSSFTPTLYEDSTKQFQQMFLEMQKKTVFAWNNTRSLDTSISAMVNNLQYKFKKRIKIHFKTDLKSAINLENGNRTQAFNQLSGIINDCLYTEAMYVMQKSDLTSDARSTTKLKESSTYNRYCKSFKCTRGWYGGPNNNKEEKYDPENFRSRQCMQFFNASNAINSLSAEFNRDGKICGKTLKEIYKKGK